jgi:histidine triad (HIT) family protein
MPSIFTKILNGEIPSYKVVETEHCFAFLDINPLAAGHTLVIPKKEVDYIFDLDELTYMQLQLTAKKVAKAIKSVVPCNRIGVAVIGLEVPHAHIHLVPINHIGDINFAKAKIQMGEDELKNLAAKIAKAYSKLP